MCGRTLQLGGRLVTVITASVDGRQVIYVERKFATNPRKFNGTEQSIAIVGPMEMTQKSSQALVRPGLLVLANSREKILAQQNYLMVWPGYSLTLSTSGIVTEL